MKKSIHLILVIVFSAGSAAAFGGCGKGGGAGAAEACDSAALSDALGKAGPGDTVKVGACRISGSFTVPAGVSLEGAGKEVSVLSSVGDRPVLRLTPGEEPAKVTRVSVDSSGLAGILTEGEGAASIEGVSVRATRGIAIGAEGLSSLVLSEVTLSGPVTEENANNYMPDITAEDTATHGIVLVRVASASLSNVAASGFAIFGALLVESTTEWQEGGVSGNMGTGLMVHAGSATLGNLGMCRTLQGLRLIPPYGGVFVAGASVETSGLEVCEGDGYGLLHESAAAHHVDLKAHDNGDTAVWVQNCPSFEISGEGTEIKNNKFAGVILVETGEAVLGDAKIEANSTTVRVFEESGAVRVGDGIQVVKPAGPVTLRNLFISNNERVGILIDLGGDSFEGVTLEGIVVEGTGEQYGALAQDGDIPDGWDSGVTRRGAVATNDEAFTGTLPIVGLVPSKSMPTAADIALNGVAAIIGDPG